MSRRFSFKRTCVLAWAAALTIPVVLVMGIGWPWLEETRDLKQQIESLDDQAASYRRLLQTLPELQTELEQARSNKDAKDFYFDAKTPALAGAELQREVQKMVKSAGGRVSSTQLLPAREDEQPPRVRVRTQIQGTTDALLDVLYQIDKARPFLFIEQITIRAPAQRRVARRKSRTRRNRPGLKPPQGTNLTVRLDVFGFASGKTP